MVFQFVRFAIGEQVGDQAHRGPGRKDVGAARRVLLEDVVLDGARDLFRRASLLLRHELIEQQQHRRGGIDRHRRRDPVQGYAVKQDLHVLERVDRDTDLADLAVGHGVVRVIADLGGQVEGDREPGLALVEQVAVALVGFRRCAEACVLAHGPQAAAIHVFVDAPRVWECARRRFLAAPILRRVNRLQRDAAVVSEGGLPPVATVGHVSTNSVSTPPTLLG